VAGILNRHQPLSPLETMPSCGVAVNPTDEILFRTAFFLQFPEGPPNVLFTALEEPSPLNEITIPP
jgi:hypothetical protein